MKYYFRAMKLLREIKGDLEALNYPASPESVDSVCYLEWVRFYGKKPQNHPLPEEIINKIDILQMWSHCPHQKRRLHCSVCTKFREARIRIGGLFVNLHTES